MKTRSSTSESVILKPTSVYKMTQETMMAEIKELLPSLVKTIVQSELQLMLKKRDELKLEITDLKKKVDGYKTQVDHWVELVKKNR